MADVIDLSERFHRDNLIVANPLEFRQGEWETGHAMMCPRAESERFEAHRQEALRAGHGHISFVPNHFTLDGGAHYTFVGLFRFRNEEVMMRRVYRLAGLMECATRAPSAILRSDLLRRFYQAILEEREELNVVWRGNVRHFLLPLHPELRNPNLFLHNVEKAETLKDLFQAVSDETDTQFDILRSHYVFYLPRSFTRA
jgi:hypothetical protein